MVETLFSYSRLISNFNIQFLVNIPLTNEHIGLLLCPSVFEIVSFLMSMLALVTICLCFGDMNMNNPTDELIILMLRI